ncbi:MAG: NfeD family protein [Deltaproteobacteria bacterium]|nr:NfeD family protein [Deltaproteobacteria bacterium]MBR5704797.1 NfeD family protein [Deltaproteobacteria bacterium]
MEYWHWLIVGVALTVSEIFIPGFTIFWFGLGGFIVALLLWIFPALSLAWQLVLWMVASSLFAIWWFVVIKPRMVDRTKAGLSREAIIGEYGMAIRAPEENRRGIMRFALPVLGSDEWSFICDQPVAVGDRLKVRDISGNDLIVEKVGN